MKEFQLDVVTPSKKAFSGKIRSVTVPGTLGSFQVLYNHAPLLSSLEIGTIKIVDEEGRESFYATSGGTIEVKDNNVLILAETFESPVEIILERAQSAMNRAKQRLQEKTEIDIPRAEGALARAANRIRIATKYKVTIIN